MKLKALLFPSQAPWRVAAVWHFFQPQNPSGQKIDTPHQLNPLFVDPTSTNVSQPQIVATMSGNKIFDVAICTIFAREFLEGAIIIGQYR